MAMHMTKEPEERGIDRRLAHNSSIWQFPYDQGPRRNGLCPKCDEICVLNFILRFYWVFMLILGDFAHFGGIWSPI
jgi:hypothetical protein